MSDGAEGGPLRTQAEQRGPELGAAGKPLDWLGSCS